MFNAQNRCQINREHTQTFAGAQKIIDDRIQLEYEREQQEQLLLSVIPAYIAAEVKRRILNKMDEVSGNNSRTNGTSNGNGNGKMNANHGGNNNASSGRSNNFQKLDLLPKTPQKQRFHELYVQRHNNVRY